MSSNHSDKNDSEQRLSGINGNFSDYLTEYAQHRPPAVEKLPAGDFYRHDEYRPETVVGAMDLAYSTAERDIGNGYGDRAYSNALRTLDAGLAARRNIPYSDINANITIGMLAARDMATRYDRPGWANDAVTTKARREFAAHYDQRDAQTVSASILQSLHADGFDQHLTDSAIKVLERISLTDLKVLDSSLRAQRNLPVDHVEFRDFAATQSSVGLANDVINSLNLVGHDSAHQFAGALQILGQQPVNNPNDSRHAVVAGLLAISPHGDTHTDALTRRVHQAESLIHHDSTAQATFALRAVSDGIATIYGNGDIFVPNSPEAPPTKLANIRDQEPSGASAVVNSGRPLPQAPPNAQQGIPPVGGQTRTTDNGVGSSASPQENKRHRKNLFDLIFGVRQSTNYGALRQIPHNAGTPGLGKIPQAPGGEVGANVGSAASTAKLVTSAKPSKPMAPRV